jgi:hypothetical protein
VHLTRRVRSLLGVAVVGTIMGVGGFAIAAFIQQSTSNPVAGSAESFDPIVVTGAQTGNLLPGETADVTLTFTNPNTNVRAKLTSIAGGDIVVDTVDDPGDAAYCQGQIALSTANAGPLPTLDVSQANHPFVLTGAVALLEDTDIRCQGMTFHTTWTVESQAVR